MIKLIASDMDGTLLNDNKEMDSEIDAVLEELNKKQIHFVAASGRQRNSLEKLFEKHLKDVTIVAENGAYVVHDGKELYASCMPQQLVEQVLKELYQLQGIDIQLCTRQHCYTNSVDLYENLRSPKFHYDIVLVEDFSHVKEDIIKISLVDTSYKGASEYSFPLLSQSLADKVEIAVSGFDCVDIVNKGVSKGTAIEALQNMWHITPEETMAFGDHFNDVQMLQRAKYSFAMKKADPGVKAYANYIAGDNNENAVTTEIKKYIFEVTK
mgnify:CR=1 FL=1